MSAMTALRPSHCRLDGRFASVVGLDPSAHAASLYQEVAGPEHEEEWTYLFDGPYDERATFEAALRDKAASSDPLFFSILERASGHAVGYAAYMRIEPAHRVIEIGNLMFGPRLRRSPAATEAMYLMACHAFETLGYRRYEWKCHSLNEPSRRAALRFGFAFEGLFRQHMIVKGQSRDTVWYSMIDSEWPRCRRAFEEWLAPENFDDDGRQRRRLAEIREALPVD